MSEPQDSKQGAGRDGAGQGAPMAPVLDPDQVAEWLAMHPDFLCDRPDLLQGLIPPSAYQGDTVLDFQRFMIGRLQSDVSRLTRTKDQVIAASRQNASTQRQVHDAVLALLGATSFEHLIHIATADLAPMLDVDMVTVCMESDPRQRASRTPGVINLLPGTIDTLLGHDRQILLRAHSSQQAMLFGPGAQLIRSDALVRLRFGAGTPPGLFAFGAREPGRFDSGQGTELLSFLGHAMERCVQTWLDLPRDF